MLMKNAKLQNHRIDLVSSEDALNFCLDRIKNGQNTHVVTINPEMIVSTKANRRFSNIINNADLNIADGVGIKIALKMKTIDIQNIRGVDFSRKLLEIASNNNLKVALLGAKEEVILKAVENIKTWFPNINIVYSRNGYFDNVDEVKNDIINSEPNILLVALGSPNQEYFISEILPSLNSCTAVGVGGSFDVYSGLTIEAPEIYRKMGLEWLYRTISDPKRFKRIFPTLPIFLIDSIIESIREKFFIYEWCYWICKKS